MGARGWFFFFCCAAEYNFHTTALHLVNHQPNWRLVFSRCLPVCSLATAGHSTLLFYGVVVSTIVYVQCIKQERGGRRFSQARVVVLCLQLYFPCLKKDAPVSIVSSYRACLPSYVPAEGVYGDVVGGMAQHLQFTSASPRYSFSKHVLLLLESCFK